MCKFGTSTTLSGTSRARRPRPCRRCRSGKCSFTLAEAHSACAAGEPLTLELMRPPDLERTLSPASGAGARAATPAAVVHLTFARPADGEPWSRAETLSLAHSTVNYCFPGGPSAAAAAASVFAPPSTPRRGTQTKELQVSEHMLCCACGYAVPRAVLRMLRDDARRHATPPLEMDSSKLKLDDSNGSSSPEMSRRDEADPSRLLACLSPDGWRRHLNWLEQSLAQLHGAFQHEHGFKQSTMKTSVPLAPMAINLHLNVLDVVEADGAAPSKTPLCRSLHATISTGAFAAHNLGFSDGGAAEHETRLLQLLSHGPNSPMRSSVIYHPPTVRDRPMPRSTPTRSVSRYSCAKHTRPRRVFLRVLPPSSRRVRTMAGFFSLCLLVSSFTWSRC